MFLSTIDIINLPIYLYILVSSQIYHSYGYKDKTYSPVMLFVPVLVNLVYMFTLRYVRMGKDRKDIGKDQTLYYVYIIYYIERGIKNEVRSIFSSWFPLQSFSTTHSFSCILFIFNV